MRKHVRNARSGRHIRIGAAVAGLATALVLTGCGSSDDGDDKAKDKGADSSSSAGAGSHSPDKGDGGAGAGAKGGSLEGSWVATTGGKPIALVVSGKSAALVGEHVCHGTAGEEMGMQMINLKCSDGNKDRTSGRVESVDAKTLKVAWEGFGKDEFKKTEKDGKLPEGLPTAGLPQS